MGFLEYAWTVSLQKDNMKVKIVLDPLLNQPTLKPDTFGFTANLPTAHIIDDEHVSFLGQPFPSDTNGKAKVGRLFRAAVVHLTAQTLLPLPQDKIAPQLSSESIITVFAKSLASNVLVNAYIQALQPDRLADLAYANALAFSKTKPAERILTPATRIMTALLSTVNIGTVKGLLSPEQKKTVNKLIIKLMTLKEAFTASLTSNTPLNTEEVFDENVNSIAEALESFGPFLEAPSLPYMEQTGLCSIFTETQTPSDLEGESVFRKSMETLGGLVPLEGAVDSCWKREQGIEALQAFDSEQHQELKNEKILARINQYLEGTRFKSVSFPDEDYTQYLRARTFLQGGSRRLLDSLRVAQDALDEDPGKEMGQLDMTAVIQALASKKPATDVFFKDEYLSKSFAWSIIFDASSSMQAKGEKARALAICVAEAAKELLMDPASWTFFAFSDKFYVLKDSTEAYTRKVRARIGGLKFGGLTYMPDAIQVAGHILSKRYDEQRILVVISDGQPYGYGGILDALTEYIDRLVKKDVIVIGVGVETDRMCNFFKLNAAVYNQKDLIKRFSKIFVDASAATLEA
jgi:Mg-chelatase subunit ChlD